MSDGVRGDLDLLLEAWAGGERLTEAEAAAVRRAVLEAPALDYRWWSRLTGQVNAAVQAAGVSDPVRAALRRSLRPDPRVVWSAA